MAYVRFLGDSIVRKAVVSPDKNIVTIKFEGSKFVSEKGFDVFLDEKCQVDIGGKFYRKFTTIYRNNKETEKYNGYQLSSDGSKYVEPEPLPTPVPQEPTIEELQEMKVVEMNTEQQKTIQKGVDVVLTSGETEHFMLSEHDQTSLIGLQTKVIAGEEQIPWHNSDETEHCKFYSNADMALITNTSMGYVTWHVTYFRDLRIYIRSLQTKEEIEAVFYGMDIPEEYRSEPLIGMMAAKL